MRRDLADELREYGPARAAFIAAAAASLKLDVGVCGDRARAAAMHALDRGIVAAEEAMHGRRRA